jgi:predicted ATPase
MLTWLLKSAEQQPVLSVWEDLHWADPSTVEWLGLLIEHVVATRLLVVLTFRPEFVPPWPVRSHLRPLTLSRFTSKDSEAMIEKIVRGKQLPVEVREQIVNKTDGVPLFVEESTKMILESGLLQEREDAYVLTGALPPLAIPATVHDSLVARLDRLGAAREVAQLGATCGREFSYELIRAVTPLDEPGLRQALGKLVQTEILYQRGIGPESQYIFKHALIQDAAYQSLLKSKRQQYHQQIAHTLEERFPEIKETEPELLAHHYTEAGLVAQAIPYWQKAGQTAIQRSANAEAISHLRRALALLSDLPENVERVQLELALQTMIGVPLMATKGYAAAEVESTYARANELCQRIGETPQLFQVLSGLFAFYLVRGNLRTARTLAEQCLRLAENVKDRTLLLEAHRMVGNSLYFLGEFPAALRHLEQAITLYDHQHHRTLAFISGQDPGVASRSFAAWCLWMLGYVDQAQARSDEAVALARELGHANTLGLALSLAANFHNSRREWSAALKCAEAVASLAEEQGLVFWGALGVFNLGVALTNLGQYEKGMTKLHQGLEMYQAAGAGLVQGGNLAVLAAISGAMGQVDKGLHMVAEAFALIQESGERGWESQLYVVKGGLILHSDHPGRADEAEACFHNAIKSARRLQTKSPELRATINLARLWRRQGKHEKAHKMLSDIYGWFTEGFDTPDLKDARALLEELAKS